MASTSVKVGVVALAVILAGGIGYFIYSNATSGVAEIDITIGLGTQYFTPANATVALGQKVTIVVFNDDDNPHAFAIQAFNASTGIIQPSLTGRVTFIANQAGNFPFYAPVNSTNAQGETNLNGTLTVKG